MSAEIGGFVPEDVEISNSSFEPKEVKKSQIERLKEKFDEITWLKLNGKEETTRYAEVKANLLQIRPDSVLLISNLELFFKSKDPDLMLLGLDTFENLAEEREESCTGIGRTLLRLFDFSDKEVLEKVTPKILEILQKTYFYRLHLRCNKPEVWASGERDALASDYDAMASILENSIKVYQGKELPPQIQKFAEFCHELWEINDKQLLPSMLVNLDLSYEPDSKPQNPARVLRLGILTDQILNKRENSEEPLSLDELTAIVYDWMKSVGKANPDIFNTTLSSTLIFGLEGLERQKKEKKRKSLESSALTNIKYNIEDVFKLHKYIPSGAAILFREFGISDFARYPMNSLVRQVEQRENTNANYILMLYPKSDHNQAFYKHMMIIFKLFNQLQNNGYELRIIEGGSKPAIARLIGRLKRRYGKEGSWPGAAIVGGHGQEFQITFDQEKVLEKGHLNKEDIQDERIDVYTNFFKNCKTIVLVSCSTGKEGGMGQEISIKIGSETKVVAPNTPTNIADIEPVFDEDTHELLRLEATYNDTISDRTYKGGENTSQVDYN